MRRTERCQLLECTHFAILGARHAPHACCTCRPIRVNRGCPMHNAHVVRPARGMCGDMRPGWRLRDRPWRQCSRSVNHDGIIVCTTLAAEERWTCPSSIGTGNGVDAFVVRVTTMPIHVLPAHARVMQTLQGYPQVTILHGGVGRCDPAAAAPGGEPF